MTTSSIGDELSWRAATAARLLNARQRSSRLGAHKSRNGCTTCKDRRLKCDESKPICGRCFRSGRDCCYVPIQTAQPRRSMIGTQLSQAMDLQADEVRTFDYFLSCVAPRLAGPFDQPFWCRAVLQQAQAEPCVRAALLAISTLDEHPQYMETFLVDEACEGSPIWSVLGGRPKVSSVATAGVQLSSTGRPIRHPAFGEQLLNECQLSALKQYNRAVVCLRERLEAGTASPTLALLTCLLFICIESAQDRVETAVALLGQAGQLLARSTFEGTDGDEGALFTTLKFIFSRLSVSAALFGWHQTPAVASENTHLPEPEAKFASIGAARDAFFQLVSKSHQILCNSSPTAATFGLSEGLEVADRGEIKAYLRPSLDSQSVHNPPTESFEPVNDRHQPGWSSMLSSGAAEGPGRLPHLHQDQSRLQTRFRQWHAALIRTPGYEHQSTRALEMHYHTAFIWISTWACAQQTEFDAFTEHFEEIIRLAKLHIQHLRVEKPTYSVETAVLGPLFFTAVKCRVPLLRREAVRLMWEMPSMKEGVWSSKMTAELAARIITIEEEDPLWSSASSTSAPTAATASYHFILDDLILPPEQNRICNFGVLKNLTSNRMEVSVLRRQKTNDGVTMLVRKDYTI